MKHQSAPKAQKTPTTLKQSWPQRLRAAVGRHRLQIGIFALCFLVFAARRPEALWHAQFWAEDGPRWYQDAFDNGIRISDIFTPYSGYLTLFQRLAGVFATFFPLAIGPLVFSIIALSVEALVPVYLLSKRVTFVTQRAKLLIIAAYVLLPYTAEIHANVTNSQWYLALILFLLILIEPAKSRLVRWLDRSIIIVASLSGPFSILLSPMVVYEAWRRRHLRTEDWIVLGAAAIQLLCLALTRNNPQNAVIGYSVGTFFQIFAGQVIGGGLFGYKALSWVYFKPWIAPVMSVLALQVLAYAFVKSNKYLRYFIIFGTIIFLGALISPFGEVPGVSWWAIFVTYGFGGRYYFILHLALYISLGWIVFSKKPLLLYVRVACAVALVLALVIGVPRDFHQSLFVDMHYQTYVRKFEQAPPGAKITIPVNPGPPWKMVLVKH